MHNTITKQCGVAKWIDGLEPDDRAAVHDALASDLTTSELWRVLKDSGFVLGEVVLWRHRNDMCRCG